MPRGVMPGVMFVQAKGYGGYGIAEGQMKPNSVFIHTIEGFQSTMMSSNWTSNSYHFTIRLDGRIVQHVNIFTPAWHAGLDHSIDPRTGKPKDPKPTWWSLYRNNVSPNAHSIGISAEGSAVAGSLPLAWTTMQVESAIKILQWIREETGIEYEPNKTLVRHSYIAPHRRQDPGNMWPEADVLRALYPPTAIAPGVNIEVVIDGKRILTQPGSGGELVDGEYLYRRPIDLGELGKGWVVVGVRLP